jgi:hypothetical protein
MWEAPYAPATILLFLAPVWFGLLARRKRQSGLLWGLVLTLVSLVVGQLVFPRPLINAYAIGLIICSVPALIILAFVPRRTSAPGERHDDFQSVPPQRQTRSHKVLIGTPTLVLILVAFLLLFVAMRA